MNITVEKKENCTADINVQIPADKVAKERKNVVKEFTKHADIKGFRKGKVPAKVIESRFANDITKQVEQTLFEEAISNAVDQESLEILDLTVEDSPELTEEGGYDFKVTAIITPSYELPEYKGIDISVPSEEVTEEEIEKNLNDLAERFANFEDVEGELENGQVAIIDFTSNIDGQSVEEFAGREVGFFNGREDHMVKISEEANNFTPGLPEGLKGLKVGDSKAIEITLPEDFVINELANKTVIFDCTVKKTQQTVLPEINDDFANTLMEGQSLEDIKGFIKEQLISEKQKNNQDEKADQVVAFLKEACDFPVPENMVEAQIQREIEAIPQTEKKLKEITEKGLDKIKEEVREEAVKATRIQILLKDIAEKEEIEVSNDQIVEFVSSIAKSQKKTVTSCIAEFKKDGTLKNIYNQQKIMNTIEFLVSEANLTFTESSETQEDA